MATVYLSLGSNLGDREQHLKDAIALLEARGLHITRVSGIYETAPVDLTEQPDFLNVAAEGECDLTPSELLAHVHSVEARLGRERLIPKGPRTVDVDIVFFGDHVVDTPELTIPHPRAAERRFVLQPLSELSPAFRHPVTGLTVAEMLATTMDQPVRKVG